MDAKFSTRSPLRISGASLLALLAFLLTLFAIIFDWAVAPYLGTRMSMFVPLGICALASAALGYWAVPLLQDLKTGQIVREDGPQAHLKKAGTPTMGGAFFIPVGVLFALILSGFNPDVTAVSIVTLAYAAIGWVDDWQVLKRKSNKGISPRMKLALQIVCAVLFCLWLSITKSTELTNLVLPLGIVIPLGAMFWPLAGFVIVAESNATNLTDGVDGLAAGTGAIASLGLGAMVAPNSPSLAIFCVCLSGACLGFVVHNRNPATVFMGDTGSLALGGALAAVGIISQNIWGLFIISGIFFVESLSVIAQVSYYKATKGSDGKGKRLLRMAPLHHHLELGGWPETNIVGVFYLISAGLVILPLVFF